MLRSLKFTALALGMMGAAHAMAGPWLYSSYTVYIRFVYYHKRRITRAA